jgi:hypothetical protein
MDVEMGDWEDGDRRKSVCEAEICLVSRKAIENGSMSNLRVVGMELGVSGVQIPRSGV